MLHDNAFQPYAGDAATTPTGPSGSVPTSGIVLVQVLASAWDAASPTSLRNRFQDPVSGPPVSHSLLADRWWGQWLEAVVAATWGTRLGAPYNLGAYPTLSYVRTQWATVQAQSAPHPSP